MALPKTSGRVPMRSELVEHTYERMERPLVGCVDGSARLRAAMVRDRGPRPRTEAPVTVARDH